MSGINAPEQTIQGYRLSPQQERLWLLGQGGEQAYHDARCEVRLEGELDPGVLKMAIQQVVQRHEILRTTLQGLPGMKFPLQVISETVAISCEEQDLTAATPCVQKSWSDAFLRTTPEGVAEETHGSLLRFNLVKLGSARYALHLSLPAHCSDRATLKNLVHEISRAYQACLRGEHGHDDVPLQYADFAEWQQTLLEDETGETGRVHWLKQADIVGRHLQKRLPFEHMPAERMSFTSKRLAVTVVPESVQRIDNMAESHGVSGSVVLLACWCVLLQRLTTQEDVLIGVACDGRTHQDMREAIGPFTKYVPVSVKPDSASPFSAFVQHLQQMVVEGQEWQEYLTWTDLQEAEQNPGERYFPFCFEFDEQLPVDPEVTPAFLIEYSRAFVDRFKVRFVCERKGNGIDAALEYDPAFYSDDLVASYAEQLATLVSQAAGKPDMSICDMDMLSAVERHRVLTTFNESGSVDGQNQCLHHLFETQVRLTPDGVAVVYEEQTLTYYELNRRADQLACYLRNRGIGPETAVGICMERSPELIVGLLAILKSGGAYVPIDPSYPKDRIVYMLEDSRAPLLLTQRRFRDDLTGISADIVDLDGEPHIFERDCGQSAITETPDRVAYIIYTSGSTGHPKGVLVSHRSAVHSTLARHSYYKDPVSRFLLLSSVAFDSSIAGIFWTLSQGGRLCLLREGLQKNPADIGDVIEQEGVTHALCLPSLYSLLLDQVRTQRLRFLHTVIVAGETCPRELVARHHAQMAGVRLFNEYGPTEGTVWSSVYQSRLSDEGMTVPIGRPIDGIKIYLLDPQLRPVAIGMPGELHIAGAGLARGYHKRADLTSEKFIPDPFSSTSGGRLYRTGDLARYRPDGQIEFIGRRDQQVKLRGYRIELGEIDAQLTEHREIQEVVVLARDTGSGEKQLVAYLVSKNAMLDAVAVKEFLKARLPEYMIPSAVVFLDALPLTPNGKLDRHALPAPDVSGQLAHQYVMPRTPTEELLTGMWAHLLRVPRVGIHDNFFDLGGHSLLATQVMARVRSVFCVELPLRTLFEATTVAQLAEAIESRRLQTGDPVAPPMVRVNRDRPIPLSFAQQRLWVLTQLDPDGAAYNLPIALRLSGTLDVQALEGSITEVLRRHEALRTIFSQMEGQAVQIVMPPSAMTIPIVSLEQVRSSERNAALLRLATAEAQRPFELAYGPMLRVTLLRLGVQEHVLLLTMHHIVSDAWSSHLLVREITELYVAQVQGKPASLPELPIQYADFSVWQRQWLSGTHLERQIDYWKERLVGALEPLALPMERPRPPVQTSHGASLTITLSSELCSAITEFSRREGVTLFMTLLAGFYALLFRYTGRPDLIVGSPIANRTRSEIEGLVGFFVNTLALRADLSGTQTVHELLALVRQVCLGAYTYQDVPFEKLVEVLQPVRDVSYSPIFQVMFELQHAPVSELAVPGLHITTVEVEPLTAKFDLTLTLCETEGGLTASMEYNTDLFFADSMSRMLHHYELILRDMTAQPGATIDELRLLTDREEQLVLKDWNNGSRLSVPDRSLSQLFEAQVSATPDSVAAVCMNRRVTYQELNRRANRVAHALRLKGVGPEIVVAILGDRDLDFLAMLLGIVKTGGIYLPLDTGHPDQRLAHMLTESRPRVLLTTETYRQRVMPLREGLSEHEPPILLTMEEIQSSVNDDINPFTSVHLRGAAYVIYTSGSTGAPKGAIVEHRGMLNHLWGKVSTLHLTAEDVIAQTASQCFDISVWQFLAPLLCGGRVCIVPDDIAHDPGRLLHYVEAAGVTILEAVPAMLQGMLDMAANSGEREPALARLRMVLPTGEALPASLCRHWLARYPSVPLINAYGPAECADDVALHPVMQIPEEHVTSMPVGRPVPNIELYVLSSSLTPLPIGVVGELCVAGVGVGRGYLCDPAKTAEVFIPHPFVCEPGARLYRTGDMAKYLPNGDIQFLGRMDHQVKVRGFRIELGEIESQLLEHPEVHEAVVVAKEDDRGNKRLVAYVSGCASGDALRGFLGERLPDYMVPQVVVLESLPRNANGKLDRRALPEPTGRDPHRMFVAPCTEIEATLAREWAEVLGLPQVGVHDNFFDLGGHSLLAAQLISRIQRIIGKPIALLDLFQAPTVESLAKRMVSQSETESSSLVVLQAGRRQAPLFCFDPTGTHVAAYQSVAYSLGQEQPVYGLPLGWIFSEPWNRLSMDLIAARYAVIIRDRQKDGPYLLLGWSNGGAIALAVAQQLERQGQSVNFLGILDTQFQTMSDSTDSVEEELLHYIQADRREAFLAVPEVERQALSDALKRLGDEDRVEYGIRWAQDRKLLSREESEASIAALKVAYALDRESAGMLRAAVQNPLQAPIHAWWTSATLRKHGKAPVDWSVCTRGIAVSETVHGEHADVVRSIQVHQRISEILSMLRGGRAQEESYAVQP